MQVILPLFLLFSAVCGKRFLRKAGPAGTIPRYLRDTPYLNLRFAFEDNETDKHVVSVKGFQNPKDTLSFERKQTLSRLFASLHNKMTAFVMWDETEEADLNAKAVFMIKKDNTLHEISTEGRADEPDSPDKSHLRAAVEKLVEYQKQDTRMRKSRQRGGTVRTIHAHFIC
eukprot:Platyproteum_vivax@DN7293_c0_g2_i5.p1